MLTVKNVAVTKHSIKHTEELDKIVSLMDKHGYSSGYSMLPKNDWHTMSFELHDTNASFANGVRRVLVEELDVIAMSTTEASIQTDDEFISGMNDVLIKNLGLVPIYQDSAIDDKYDIYLNAYNNTNDIIDIKASSITIVPKKSKSESKSESLVDKLIPESNITLIRLRPGKYLKIEKIEFETGTGASNAGKFSLLNNVTYKPLDIVPYDQFTDKGTRTISHDCKNFAISFTTKGNIQPSIVMEKVRDKIKAGLTDIKNKIEIYSKTEPTAFYSGQDCEVEIINDIRHYKFTSHYITLMYMIAHRCYKLDENILLCSATVERYDSQIGLIKLKHADCNKLLIESINACMKDADKLAV